MGPFETLAQIVYDCVNRSRARPALRIWIERIAIVIITALIVMAFFRPFG